MQILSPSPILVDQVYRSLVAAISEQRLRPGERIRQGKLAQSLGVSRQPVSHALQLLKHQGLVQDAGRQGVEVVPVDPDRIRHLYQARAGLDGLAARLAAERIACGTTAAPERTKLKRLVERGRAFGANVALPVLVEADVDFHQALYAMSGNPIIPELVAPQWAHLRRSMMTVLEAPDYRSRAWDEHAGIVRLVLAGDADGAEAAASRHAVAAGEETALRLGGADEP